MNNKEKFGYLLEIEESEGIWMPFELAFKERTNIYDEESMGENDGFETAYDEMANTRVSDGGADLGMHYVTTDDADGISEDNPVCCMAEGCDWDSRIGIDVKLDGSCVPFCGQFIAVPGTDDDFGLVGKKVRVRKVRVRPTARFEKFIEGHPLVKWTLESY